MTTVCRACAVEYADPLPAVCPICADERQYVPQTGQAWVDVAELAAAGTATRVTDLGGYFALATEPRVGIGQTGMAIPTAAGVLLWDLPGFINDAAVDFVRTLGATFWIATSHPHMFGVQLAWSAALGDAPVLVNEADAHWLGRRGDAIEFWSNEHHLGDDLTLLQLGGHFPGSAVAHWRRAEKNILFAGDTIKANPDGTTVTFMRSFPNFLPLSAAVVERIAARLRPLAFDTLWDNFARPLSPGADAAVQESAARYAAWVRGDHDEHT